MNRYREKVTGNQRIQIGVDKLAPRNQESVSTLKRGWRDNFVSEDALGYTQNQQMPAWLLLLSANVVPLPQSFIIKHWRYLCIQLMTLQIDKLEAIPKPF
jgi:hypothetical protein